MAEIVSDAEASKMCWFTDETFYLVLLSPGINFVGYAQSRKVVAIGLNLFDVSKFLYLFNLQIFIATEVLCGLCDVNHAILS